MPSPQPQCRVIHHGPAEGAWNMAVDEALLDEMAALPRDEPQAVLRFYAWAPATLSLGYFQSARDREQHAASLSCPLVRRPSGGGAILHHYELTYSLALSSGVVQATNSIDLYQITHSSLIRAFSSFGVQTCQYRDTTAQDNVSDASTFLCFKRRAANDIVLGPHKVVGSAQRKRLGAVLQHGSILLAQSQFAPELLGIREITQIDLPARALADCWAEDLSSHFGWRLEPSELSPSTMRAATNWRGDRYSSKEWVHRR